MVARLYALIASVSSGIATVFRKSKSQALRRYKLEFIQGSHEQH